MKKIWILILLLFPFPVFAYSNKLYISGEPIGIDIHAKGVYVIDFYKVKNELIGKKEGFQKGDLIIEVDSKSVTSIDELNNSLNHPGKYKVTVERKKERKDLELEVILENNKPKTGLYVKDEVIGIGTLSYIDPETKIYASLGHEILETSSMTPFESNKGSIYEVELKDIKKSENGKIGELQATFQNNIKGSILENKENGIYGFYTEELPKEETMEIASMEEVEKGEASIRLHMNDEKKDYKIEILSIHPEEEVKNIYFEVVDEELLEKTGGIVQGMSGSPILQKDKVIGVVNYVVIKESNKGYGVLIEKMLEEGDKLLQP